MSELPERKHDIKNGTFVGMVNNVTTKLTKKGTRMATFNLEDTSGHVEVVCFKFEDFAAVIQEDAVVQVKGKYEVGDRHQLMAFEVSRITLDESQEDDAPHPLELHLQMKDATQTNLQFLYGILSKYPGADGANLQVVQPDGALLRAELPCAVDGSNGSLYTELHQLFGRKVWKA